MVVYDQNFRISARTKYAKSNYGSVLTLIFFSSLYKNQDAVGKISNLLLFSPPPLLIFFWMPSIRIIESGGALFKSWAM